MVFKGTQHLDWQEITLECNKIGAELNAFTSHEATVFYARVLGECLDRALELLSDIWKRTHHGVSATLACGSDISG